MKCTLLTALTGLSTVHAQTKSVVADSLSAATPTVVVKTVTVRATPTTSVAASAAPSPDLIIFQNALNPQWDDWSPGWNCTLDLGYTGAPALPASTYYGMKATTGWYGAISLHYSKGYTYNDYAYVSFYVAVPANATTPPAFNVLLTNEDTTHAFATWEKISLASVCNPLAASTTPDWYNYIPCTVDIAKNLTSTVYNYTRINIQSNIATNNTLLLSSIRLTNNPSATSSSSAASPSPSHTAANSTTGVSQTCDDKPPSPDYSCAQQALWGKCTESWMAGYCLQSCGKCVGTSTPKSGAATTKAAVLGGLGVIGFAVSALML
ncbi:hypothetical protein HDV00_001314 [Rhizophlyctis rosea]|nr:hypothetical protein HDV00_001314 [Rhizophlyctis rosea]